MMEYFKDIDKQLKDLKEINKKISNYDIKFKRSRKNTISFKENSIIKNIPKLINKESKKERKQRLYLKRVPKKYDIYIKSKFWSNRKNKYYQKYGKRCVACGSFYFVNLHHAVYGNYGNEKDEHLFALCRSCHSEFHLNNKIKQNMLKETNDFIIEKHEIIDFPKL